jgi:hypothetical protein
MADETTQQPDPSSGSIGRARRDVKTSEAGSTSNRRRIVITSLLLCRH